MAGIRQTNFGGGELDDRLWGRTDLKIYPAGAKTLKNFFASHYGSILSRPGTYYVNNTKNNQAVRLIPFNYADIADQNYILEFGNLYVRFHTSLGSVIPLSSNYPAWLVGTTYALGAEVYLAADGFVYRSLQAGNVGHSPDISDLWWTRVVYYEVATPYVTADLPRLKYVQVGDVLTIVHPNYAPRELRRSGHTSWALITVDFTPQTIITQAWAIYPLPAADSTHVAKEWQWMVTRLTRNEYSTVVESKGFNVTEYQVPGYHPWDAAVTYASGARVSDSGTEGASANGYYVSIQNNNLNHATSDAAWWTGPLGQFPEPFHTHALPKTIAVYSDRAVTLRPPYLANTSGLTVPDNSFVGYRWYRGRGGRFGWIGDAKTSDFLDVGNEPDYTLGPPQGLNPFKIYDEVGVLTRTEYPASVAIFEQRRIFGGTDYRPQTLLGSSTDRYTDFDKGFVLKATDSIEFDLASRRREQIRSLVGLRHLMTLTNSSEWVVGGAANGDPMSPFSIRARAHSEHGSSWLDPLVIGSTLIHVQPKGTVIRDLSFDVNVDSYVGNELSIYSKHFFRGHDIVSWCYAEDPYSVCWAVRDDGVLLSMTYVKEQELFAWAQHETNGTIEQAASIPEGKEDSVYLVALRNGQRFIERMATREIAVVADSHCVDAGIFYSGGSTVVPGLGHLEGLEVKALVDGNVVNGLTVTGGAITLPAAGSKVHVGLGYTATFEALDVPSDREKQKIVKEVLVDLVGSRGIWMGEDLASMVEWPTREPADLFGAIPLNTVTARVTTSGKWGLGGRTVVQQRDPLPLTIVAIQRELVAGGS